MRNRITALIVAALMLLTLNAGLRPAGADTQSVYAETPGTAFAKVLDAPVSAMYLSQNFAKDRTVFALTDASGSAYNYLYRSQDGGKTWTKLAPAIDGSVLTDASRFIFDELAPQPDGLFAQGHYPDSNKRILISSQDSGDHWTTVIVKDPSDSDTDDNVIPEHIISVGSSDLLGIMGDSSDMLVSSSDNGQTWPFQLNSGVVDMAALDKNRLFMVTQSGSVFYSENAGTTWSDTKLTLTPASGRSLLGAVAAVVESSSEYTAVAVSSKDPAGLQIYRSSSDRWTKVPDGQFHAPGVTSPGRAYCAALLPGGEIFAGTPDNAVLASEDYGQTWNPLNITGEVDQIVAASWGGHRVLLAASQAGIYRLIYQPGDVQPSQPAQPGQPAQPQAAPATFTVGQSSFTVNGVVNYSDAAPFIAGERVYVPVRYLGQALGADTYWDGDVQQVTLKKDRVLVYLIVGKPQIIVAGNATPLDVAPLVRDGRTYLPARYVAEAFGYTATWNAVSQTVTIAPKPSAS